MLEAIEIHIIEKIKRVKRGSAFFVDDFLRFSLSKAVGKALERLVMRGEISRVVRGIHA